MGSGDLRGEAAENPALPEAARRDFRTIVEHIGIESRLIDDLLDISRITHDKLPLNRRPFHLHPLLRRVLTVVEAELKEKSLGAISVSRPAIPS